MRLVVHPARRGGGRLGALPRAGDGAAAVVAAGLLSQPRPLHACRNAATAGLLSPPRVRKRWTWPTSCLAPSYLGALPRLPIRSFTACGAAGSAQADRQTGAVPLLRVDLRCMDLCDEGHERGATSVLARHQRSLQVLRMDFVFNARRKELSRRPWSVPSLQRHIGSLPALKELSLAAMSSADAAAVAAACAERGVSDDAG